MDDEKQVKYHGWIVVEDGGKSFKDKRGLRRGTQQVPAPGQASVSEAGTKSRVETGGYSPDNNATGTCQLASPVVY